MYFLVSTQLHVAAVRRAVRDLGMRLDPVMLLGLFTGLREVDLHPDFLRDPPCIIPHGLPSTPRLQQVKSKVVQYYLEKALHYYRWGCSYMAGRCLGRALHYVMDEAVYVDPKTAPEDLARYVVDSRYRSVVLNNMAETAAQLLSEFRRHARPHRAQSLLLRIVTAALACATPLLALVHPAFLILPGIPLLVATLLSKRSMPKPPEEVVTWL